MQGLEELARGKGHPNFPFLDAAYSPGSRVPCTDFTFWIAGRLEANDLTAVKYLMQQIVAGNPGLGVDGSWAADLVDFVVAMPLERYVGFSSTAAYFELRAILILLGLDETSDKRMRGFSLATPKGRTLAEIIACQCPRWSDDILHLRDQANTFIKRMRRDTPFWKEFPLFKDVLLPVRQETAIDMQFQKLTPAARLDLYLVSDHGPMQVDRLGSGGPFGRDTARSHEQLEALGLVATVRDEGAAVALWDKGELLELCGSLGISHRKGWKKNLLLGALRTARPDLVENRMATHAPIAVTPETANLVAGVRLHAEGITTACNLLLLA
ncbi:MAG: hypothetical protein ABIT01_15920 [Thermoanaerobaculia bacterium]